MYSCVGRAVQIGEFDVKMATIEFPGYRLNLT